MKKYILERKNEQIIEILLLSLIWNSVYTISFSNLALFLFYLSIYL